MKYTIKPLVFYMYPDERRAHTPGFLYYDIVKLQKSRYQLRIFDRRAPQAPLKVKEFNKLKEARIAANRHHTRLISRWLEEVSDD